MVGHDANSFGCWIFDGMIKQWGHNNRGCSDRSLTKRVNEGHIGRAIEDPMGPTSIMGESGFIAWECVQLGAGEMPAV